MLISVIIPVYNGEKFLAEGIRSILAQNDIPIEIIVIDDGSADSSAKIAQSFDVTYLYQNNKGVAAARNAGLRNSRGKIIGFLDQDDLWPPGRLHKLSRALEDADAVYGLTTTTFTSIERADHTGYQWLLGSGLFRREVFDKIGILDETIGADDMDFYIRMSEAHLNIKYVNTQALIYRIHGENTFLKSPPNSLLAEAFKLSLDRRRAKKDMSVSSKPEILSVDWNENDSYS